MYKHVLQTVNNLPCEKTRYAWLDKRKRAEWQGENTRLWGQGNRPPTTDHNQSGDKFGPLPG